jgi:hypothetical protein
LYNTILSRDSLEIEQLVLDDHSKQRGTIEGRLRFYDHSRLEFDEVVLVRDKQLVKLRYAYHYQNAQNELIFRYDNAPHHPTVATFPHHKHVGMKVEPTEAPDLSEVLKEIELLIY